MSNEAAELRKKRSSVFAVQTSLQQSVIKNNKFKLKNEFCLFLLSVAVV